MFGHIYKSCLSINNFLWEPVGIVFLAALVFLFRDKKRFWKDPLFITLALLSLFALGWRIYIHAVGRYFAITALPVMFVIFNFIWRIPLHKAIRCLLFAVIVLACFCRDMRGNPCERDQISLYRKIGEDAGKYSEARIVSFTTQIVRQMLYSGQRVSGVDRDIPVPEIVNNLRGNLSFFDGICDVVYIYVQYRRSEYDPTDDFLKLMPGERIKLMGRCFVDRSRKKELLVFKYETGNSDRTVNEKDFKLMENGDFSQVRTGENAQKYNLRLARRAPRFGKEQPQLPERFNIYHSLIAFSNSIACVERRNDKNVLRVEANGSYLGVLTPQIDMRKERFISFNIKVNRPSSLQINRSVAGRGLFPFFTVELEPSAEKRYTLRLEASGANGDVWFWLNDGDIELSDLRIK